MYKMKLFTTKTNKADLLLAANDLLEQQQVLIGLLLLTVTIGILFWNYLHYYSVLYYL